MNTLRNVTIACLLAAAIASARTDIWDPATVEVFRVELHSMPDGGCRVQAHATMAKQDGGRTVETSSLVEVSGANQATCLDILNVKAPNLFRADRGI